MTANRIFVFGSNLAGIHGKGSALAAVRRHGAIRGQGVGLQGQAWAIPTKKHWRSPALPLSEIAPHIQELIRYARANPTTRFDVVRIGCGQAGYQDTDIAPLFAGAPANMDLPTGWRAILAEMERVQIQEGCEKAVALIKGGARGIIRV